MANLKAVVAGNVGMNLASEFITTLLTFFVPVVIGRYLGSEVLGQFSFILAFAWVFGELSEFGYATIIKRDVARNRRLRDVYVGNIMTLSLVTMGLAFFAGLAYLAFTDYSFQLKALALLTLVAFLAARFSSTLRAMFFVDHKVVYEAAVKVFSAIVYLPTILLVWWGYGLVMICVMNVARYVSRLFFAFLFYVKRYGIPKFRADIRIWKTLSHAALPLWFVSSFAVLFFRLDIMLLSLLAGDAATGYYSAAFRIVEVLTLIPIGVIAVIFPVLSRAHGSGKAAFSAASSLTLRWLAIIMLPFVAGGIAASSEIIRLLFSDQFTPSARVLEVLLIALLFYSFFVLLSHILVAQNRQSVYAIIYACIVVLNLVLLSLFIPWWGESGAALATALSFCCGFLLFSWCTRGIITLRRFVGSVWRPALASCIMGIFAGYIISLGVMIVVPLCALFYLALILLVGAVKKEEFAMVWGALKSRFS